MGMWEWLIGFSLKRLGKIEVERDTYGSLKSLTLSLQKQFPNAVISINDKRPYFISDEDMIDIQQLQFVRLRKWVNEKFDCDDFASVMKGIMSWFYGGFAFGTVKVKTGKNSAHALNCYINQFGKFVFVEPQTGKAFSPSSRPDWEVYWIDI